MFLFMWNNQFNLNFILQVPPTVCLHKTERWELHIRRTYERTNGRRGGIS